MRLRECSIQQFMGIESLQLDLDAPVVLLLGDNGAGKSSVLKALRVAIGAWLQGVAEKDISPPSISSEMLRRVCVREGNEVVFRRARVDTDIAVSGVLSDGTECSWSVSHAPRDKSRTRYLGSKELKKISTDWIGGEEANKVLPIVSYFGARRVRGRSRRGKGGIEPPSMGYARALDSSVDTSRLLARWDRLDRQAGRSDDAKAIRSALEKCLSALIPGGGTVSYDPTFEEPVIQAELEGWALQRFGTLSDGFRNVVEIGMDLALRAIQLNPSLGERAITDTPGVVLIDELDQHLHPTWQIQVLKSLRSAFPSIQFIVASHSPFVALHRTDDTLTYRLNYGPHGTSARPAAELGHRVDATLRTDGFGPMVTWGPALLAAMHERTELLITANGSVTSDLKDRLEASAVRIAKLREVRPTHIEDIVRRLTKEAEDEYDKQPPSKAGLARFKALEEAARKALAAKIERDGWP